MKPKRSLPSKKTIAGLAAFKRHTMSSSNQPMKPSVAAVQSTIAVAPDEPVAGAGGQGFVFVCYGCKKPIKPDTNKYLLHACDKYWHENCLKCDRCHGRLGEMGASLYDKSGMLLCRQDYLELFGKTGVCSECEKTIGPTEMVMRAKQNVYHLECFACHVCKERFCVDDQFYLCENKVVCKYDYEDCILPIQRRLDHEKRAAIDFRSHSDALTLADPAQSLSGEAGLSPAPHLVIFPAAQPAGLQSGGAPVPSSEQSALSSHTRPAGEPNATKRLAVERAPNHLHHHPLHSNQQSAHRRADTDEPLASGEQRRAKVDKTAAEEPLRTGGEAASANKAATDQRSHDEMVVNDTTTTTMAPPTTTSAMWARSVDS